MVKILVLGDLHGQIPQFRFNDFDCIICTGDVASDKDISPFYIKYFRFLKDSEEKISFEDFVEKIEKKGKGFVRRMEKFSLAEGRKVLEHLNKLGKPVFIVPGNWDDSYGKSRIKFPEKNEYNYHKSFMDKYLGDEINTKLVRGLKNIYDCQFKLHDLVGFNILGYGLSSTYENPSLRKSRLKGISKTHFSILKKHYKKLYEKLDSLYEKRNKKLKTIFLTHNVPYNTKLDVVLNKKSPVYKKHLGSSIARDFCVKNRPLLCIGGHMHEHFGKDKIGRTTIINAGYGKEAQILIDLDENKGRIRKLQFNRNYQRK